MPLFDYSCTKCGTVFEVERRFGATGAVKCASCGSTRTSKIFSAAGIVFKGSGFYVTDSKSKSETAAESKDKPVEVKPEGKSTDAKPADTTSGASKPAEVKPAPAAKASTPAKSGSGD